MARGDIVNNVVMFGIQGEGIVARLVLRRVPQVGEQVTLDLRRMKDATETDMGAGVDREKLRFRTFTVTHVHNIIVGEYLPMAHDDVVSVNYHVNLKE